MNKLYLKAQLVKAADGKIQFIASDDTVDRSGESIPVDSWDLSNFTKSPRLLVDHDYRVESIVGVAEDIRIEDGKLMFSPKFHAITELAKQVSQMVTEGMLDTVSVGFMRKGDKKAGIQNELMEISFVAVPANPNARMLSVKSLEGVAGFLKGYEAEEKAEEPADEPKAGDTCTMEDGTEGILEAGEDGGLSCVLKPSTEAVKEPAAGDVCTMEDGTEGVLVAGDDGALSCQLKPTDEPAEEAAKAAVKGMTEDVLEAGAQMRKIKYKYADLAYMKFNDFCCAYFSDAVKVEDVATLAKELSERLLEVAAMPVEDLPGDMMWCGYDSATKSMTEFAVKSGRVLSSKNRDMIQSQIASLEAVIAALKDLHAATDPQGDEEKAKAASKVERSKSTTPTLDAIKLYEGLTKHNDARRVLRTINVATSEALRDYNRAEK